MPPSVKCKEQASSGGREWSAILVLIIHAVSLAPPSLAAGMKLGDMCRLKGQETNTLQGLGLVVGLRGTGDSDAAPTARALARMMQLMGGPMAIDPTGKLDLGDVAEGVFNEAFKHAQK